MPIYEYSCQKCGEVVEAMQKVSDEPLTECPKCHGPLSKLISSSSFILKGSGWYATDYAKKGNGSGNGKSARSTDIKEHLKDVEGKKEASDTGGKSSNADTKPDKSDKTVKAAADD